MILFKKSHAEQLLHLALALSLLRANPSNYRAYSWNRQFASPQNGGGIQMEMQTLPIHDYSYTTRKAAIPIIEDLIHIQRFPSHRSYDIQTYLLNIQNEQNGGGGATESTAGPVDEPALAGEPVQNHTGFVELDLFLNPDPFTDSASLMDLNLSDLRDYGDDLIIPPTSTTPLKDEVPDVFGTNPFATNSFGFRLDEEEAAAGTSYTSGLGSLYGGANNHSDDEAAAGEFGRIINWAQFHDMPDEESVAKVKVEHTEQLALTSSAAAAATTTTTSTEEQQQTVKEEPVEIKAEDESSSDTEAESSVSSGFVSTVELTQEESEIVEVLWKQDVDLGYSLTPYVGEEAKTATNQTEDDNEKLKALQELKDGKKDEKDELDDEWAGIQFTIDNETGEYIQLTNQLEDILQEVLQINCDDIGTEQPNSSANTDAKSCSSTSSDGAESTDDDPKLHPDNNKSDLEGSPAVKADTSPSEATKSGPASLQNLSLLNESDASELEAFDMMIQSAGPFQHPRVAAQSYGHGHTSHGAHAAAAAANSFRHQSYHQSRVPLSRAVSMEQRLQDIASLFNPLPGMGVGMGVGEMPAYPHYPTSHYPHYQTNGTQNGQFAHPHPHAAVLHHNASLADPGNSHQQPHYGGNLGNAVSSSMHITNSSHESDAGASGYKMDHDHMMYYSNTSSELNHTQDSFISSFYDDDLQLMDMNNTNEGYYMRMLDTNTTSQNSSVLGASVASGPIGLSGGLGSLAAGVGVAANPLGVSGHHVNANNNNNNGILGASMHTQLSSGGVATLGGGSAIGSTGDRLDASSDSAVSSMGSERVPSLSDSEWGDGAGSDSAQEYHQRNSSKYGNGPYDYSYSRGAGGGGDSSRVHPVAQKKHQMFGKRYFQEQGTVPSMPQSAAGGGSQSSIKYEFEPSYGMHPAMPHHSLDLGVSGAVGASGVSLGGATNKLHAGGPQQLNSTELKYSCSLDFARQTRIGAPSGPVANVHDLVAHNHTYTLPHGSGASPRPQARDKKQRKLDDEHLSRDEKRARSLNIPMPVIEIINLPMDEFNERLSKYDLSESQLSLIRDIRRRGKNKVAAQNCRKRKLDQIICLADEVKEVRERKERIYRDREMGISSNEHIKRKFSLLHKHIFTHLRDADGNLYSPSEFSLQQSHDGSVHILRKDKDGARNGAAGGTSSASSSTGHHGGGGGHHNHHHHHHPGGQGGPSSQHHNSHHPHHTHHPHHPKD